MPLQSPSFVTHDRHRICLCRLRKSFTPSAAMATALVEIEPSITFIAAAC